MFNTQDITLATTLYYLGYRVDEVFKSLKSNRATFCFPDTEEIQIDIKKYWQDKIKVEPKSWSTFQRMLKDRVYELDRQPK